MLSFSFCTTKWDRRKRTEYKSQLKHNQKEIINVEQNGTQANTLPKKKNNSKL